MKGVQAIARILKQEQTEFLFAYPNNALIDACAELGIRTIMARTEKTLINMADGYCRATNGRRPAVVTVQNGPGIENAFGAVAQAYSDSIPLLLLPGGEDQHRLGTPVAFDPLPPYSHVTKMAARINFADRIPAMMRWAFTQLRTGQPGPVLLEVPVDVSRAELDEAGLRYTPPAGARSAGDPAAVAEVVRRLLDARAPLIHAGHGVLWAEAWDELRTLAERLQVPVMTTMAAKSVFPEDHPLSAGAGGHTITGTAAHLLRSCDFILGVGCSFSHGGFSPPIPPGKQLAQITSGARDIDKAYAIDVAVLGDARLVLRQLLDELDRQSGPGPHPWGEEAVETVRETKEAFLGEWKPRLTSGETPINPYRVIWDLMHTVDRRRTTVTHDSGNPRDQMLTFYEALIPRGYLGWGKSTQLGTGLGIALGAKLAYPERLVVNVMGDLAFGTAAMDVETAVRERLPVLTVILNNGRLGGYGHHMPVASERYGANRLTGNYAQVAAGLGAYSERVERPEDVVPALRRGMAATADGRPAVLEMITKEEPVYPAAAR
jgi:acetolactate synthase-1/2/3 large subunit